jgi:hypothetical protein
VLGVREHGGVLGAAVGATGGELLLAGALLYSGLWLTRGLGLSAGAGRSESRPRSWTTRDLGRAGMSGRPSGSRALGF